MKDANKDHLDDNALTYFQNSLSFRDFFEQIDMAADSFRAIGVSKGDYVSVCTPNIPQGVIAFYALNKIGAIPDMLPVMASDDEFIHYLQMVPSTAIVLFRDLYPRFKRFLSLTGIKKVVIVSPLTYIDKSKMEKPSLSLTMENIKKELKSTALFDKKAMSWSRFLSLSSGINGDTESEPLDINETALLSHTGGSTGFPKTAEMTNENFNAMVEEFKALNMTLKREYRILTILPLFINYGLCSNIHMPLCLGMETIIVPTFDAKESYDLFNRYKPNIFMCVHEYYEKMLDDSRFDNMDLSFLRFVIYGGAPMDDEKKEKFNIWLEQHGAKGVRLWNGYGMTESCATILTERVPVGGTESKLMRLPDLSIKTVDPNSGEETKIGEAGELLASGPTIMKGYFNNQEETDQVIVVDEKGTRWLRTGDLAVINEDESVRIIGRLKRMLPVIDIANGNVAKIYPDNIETVISKSEYVEKCVVVCLPEEKRVNIPMAFIKLKKDVDKDVALKDIKGRCMELNNYSRPYHFFFEDEIKFNKSEKVDLPYYESRLSTEILHKFDEELYQ